MGSKPKDKPKTKDRIEELEKKVEELGAEVEDNRHRVSRVSRSSNDNDDYMFFPGF